MNACLQQVWIGVCEECAIQISFSPQKPFVQNEHEYVCNCGAKYWINRDTGYYQILGTKHIKGD